MTDVIQSRVISGVVGQFNDDDNNRWYIDPSTPDIKLESVTAITGATEEKPYLQKWNASLAAEEAINNIDHYLKVLKTEGKQAAINEIKQAAKRMRDLKSELGRHQHNILESLVLDMPIPVVPLHLVDVEVDGEYVDHDAVSDGLLNFNEDFQPVYYMAEATVANPELGYAGTLDLIVYIPRLKKWYLLDLKNGKEIPESIREQLAAYRHATEVWLDKLGNKMPMPQVDGTAVVHLRRSYARGYKFVEFDGDKAAFTRFLDARQCLAGHRERDAKKGQVLYAPLPDGSQPPPMLEDMARVGPLIDAGIIYLSELTMFSAEELLAIKGVGPKTIEKCNELLSQHQLSLKECA